jgi:hypothetical protein
MELLKFVFAGFWHFLGTLILVAAVLNGAAEIIRALRGTPQEPEPSEAPLLSAATDAVLNNLSYYEFQNAAGDAYNAARNAIGRKRVDAIMQKNQQRS